MHSFTSPSPEPHRKFPMTIQYRPAKIKASTLGQETSRVQRDSTRKGRHTQAALTDPRVAGRQPLGVDEPSPAAAAAKAGGGRRRIHPYCRSQGRETAGPKGKIDDRFYGMRMQSYRRVPTVPSTPFLSFYFYFGCPFFRAFLWNGKVVGVVFWLIDNAIVSRPERRYCNEEFWDLRVTKPAGVNDLFISCMRHFLTIFT